MFSPLQLLACLLRAAMVLSPAAIAVLTFFWLLHLEEKEPAGRGVDAIRTTSIGR